jgi:hypothetical protein
VTNQNVSDLGACECGLGAQYFFASSSIVLTRSYIRSHNIINMSNMATTSLRQASRLCLKQPASSAALLRSSGVSRVAAISKQRRNYVSETKKDSAQVNVDTAIRADHKAFFQETGKLPERQPVPGTVVSADAMMSPMAGPYLISVSSVYSCSPFCRCIEASYYYG